MMNHHVKMITAYVGLGGNLGDVIHTFHQAKKALETHPHIHALKQASLYQTAPLGYQNQPDFINSVLSFSTELEPHTLLHTLQSIENQFGRQRLFKNAPRTLDLDLLAYGKTIIQSEVLTLPHPEIAHRLFVLMPLLEISPEWSFPNGSLAVDCLPACQSQSVHRISDQNWTLFSHHPFA